MVSERTPLNHNPQEESERGGDDGCFKGVRDYFTDFLKTYSFLVLVGIAIFLAWIYPPLGAYYLKPNITATWIAVIFIFTMAGLSMKTEELKKAFSRFYFNAFVQIFNFGLVSSIVFGFTRLILMTTNTINTSIADAMVICSCMPITVTMVIVMTKSAGGDEASAMFNAAFGSLAGVFVTPALILSYIGMTSSVDLTRVFIKLAIRVVLPVAIGQVLQKCSKSVVEFVKLYKQYFKKMQECTLVFIVYTVFCKTFSSSDGSGGSKSVDLNIRAVFWLAFFQLFLLCFVTVLAWVSLRILFRDEPKLRVMGLFGCTQKSLAMGIPLINSIYEDNPNVGLYTLPLLFWHPMQLILGTAITQKLEDAIARREAWEKEEESGTLPKRRWSSRMSLRRSSLVAYEPLDDLDSLLEEDDH